jgi:CPA2 family monovalent cation:H+ antiporter-2
VAACVGLAVLWSWKSGAGVLLGLALSVASTVVLLRVLEERNALDHRHGRIAVGWLIVQDLAMVMALVLLPALADRLGGHARGLSAPADGSLAAALAVTLGKLALFAGLVLAVGAKVVPWLLAQAARTGSRELFTLSVLASALGIAYGSAELFGVSFALGAFFAGVVLSESDLSHQAAADSLPLQDAFAVLFFVSVGMLFDPSILIQQPFRVLAVLGVIVLVKSLAAIAVLLLFRQPLAASLTVTAGLAQIGEFSFILAGLGIALDLLPPEGRDLILAGALLSITLNTPLFAMSDRIVGWLQDRPTLVARLERPRDKDRSLASLPATSERDGPRDHAIIVGYGRVGGTIGRALDAWDLPYVIVERDWRRVEELRAGGLPAIYGDASAPGILSAAGVDRARLLIVAAPDGYQARRILEIAREANPDIDTVVRTHSEAELEHLERMGVGLAVLAERELALGMMGYSLRSLGLSEGEARLFVQSARKYDDAGVMQDTAPHEAAPELRPHRTPDDVQADRPLREQNRA